MGQEGFDVDAAHGVVHIGDQSVVVSGDVEAAQAREVLVWGQEAAQAREVLVWGQEAAQAREVLVWGQEGAVL